MKPWNLLPLGVVAVLLLPVTGHAAAATDARIAAIVDRAIRPTMRRYRIPGVAVGVISPTHTGVYNFGVASKATRQPVSNRTLFEVGSISKLFTATLASYAEVEGRLSLRVPASRYLPALQGSAFDHVNPLQLGTHTAGGLPLQVPNGVSSDAQVMGYFQGWHPDYAPGTSRQYSNPGIGLLGLVAASSLDGSFDSLLEARLFPALGLKSTYLQVPAARADDYAQGYTTAGVPIRMAPGALASETYGVRTTASDLVRFVEINMGRTEVEDPVRRAVVRTHVGYFRIGAMTQDLVWEQYRYPVPLQQLLEGNSAGVIFEPNAADAIDPPLPPQDDVWINKTGSTNGFAAYVAFVPAVRIGVVILANRSYPISARVAVAYEILSRVSALTARPD